MELTGAHWRKSSHSNNGGNSCVKVAGDLPGGVIAVRDSKNRPGSVLIVSGAGCSAFTAGVRGGDFDLPLASRPV
jgi:hypothetical protein